MLRCAFIILTILWLLLIIILGQLLVAVDSGPQPRPTVYPTESYKYYPSPEDQWSEEDPRYSCVITHCLTVLK